jgi:glyoxylase-like metal-dependent hydrolase (beta-lactamase superfamily II)
MKIATLVVGPFEANCYLIANQDHDSSVIVDPGGDCERIIDHIQIHNLPPKAILLTHGHGDHIAAVKPLKEKFDIPLYVGKGDESLLASPSANISALFGFDIICPDADKILNDSDIIKVDSLQFKVLATPGHTQGGICYLIENYLFSGDTLFRESIGRTDLPGGNFRQLIESIHKKILILPDNIICLPGHGPETTIAFEKMNNPFLTESEFLT